MSKILNSTATYPTDITGSKQVTLSEFLLLAVLAMMLFLPNVSTADDHLPADPYVVELFDTYCLACHSVDTAGAPIAFDETEWSKRLEGGLSHVVNSAILGKGNMPAQGSCMECTYEDLEDLVRYMSQARAD